MRVDNPMSTPEWRAISLECKLIAQLCGAGLTSIGKADYGDGMGEYYSAFFSLSIGLERFGKLIYCLSEQRRSGVFPSDRQLRDYGHDLTEIIASVQDIAITSDINVSSEKPDSVICGKIVEHLSAFAAAGVGRYANFSIMRLGTVPSTFEPVTEWLKLVGEPVLDRHFRNTNAGRKALAYASQMEISLSDTWLVMLCSEDGTPIESVSGAIFRSAENKALQKYSRFYAFTIVRWMAEIFYELSHFLGDEEGGEYWFGQYEHFETFKVANDFGLSRKIWPLT